jgi:hypothetical protein
VVVTLLLFTRAQHDARLPRHGAARSVAELQEGLLQIGVHGQANRWVRILCGEQSREGAARLTLAELHAAYPELRTL